MFKTSCCVDYAVSSAITFFRFGGFTSFQIFYVVFIAHEMISFAAILTRLAVIVLVLRFFLDVVVF